MRFVSFIVASLALAYSSALVSAGMSGADSCQMLQLVNSARSKAGKPAMRLSKILCSSAQTHSDYMSSTNTMTHNDPRGDLGQRIMSAGFPSWSCVSENIASGQTSVSDVMTAWINSPGHYANIISTSIYCGFGVTGTYWTQEFASPADLSFDDNDDICGGGNSGNTDNTGQTAQQPVQQIADQGNGFGGIIETFVNGILVGGGSDNNYIAAPEVFTEIQTVTVVKDIYQG